MGLFFKEGQAGAVLQHLLLVFQETAQQVQRRARRTLVKCGVNTVRLGSIGGLQQKFHPPVPEKVPLPVPLQPQPGLFHDQGRRLQNIQSRRGEPPEESVLPAFFSPQALQLFPHAAGEGQLRPRDYLQSGVLFPLSVEKRFDLL